MPKVVDHDERREQIAGYALAAIARKGIPNLTLRDIAEEGGTTIGILGHYFPSRAKLIEFTFSYFVNRGLEEQRHAAESTGSGLAALRASYEAFVARGQRKTFPAILSYWVHAHTTPALAKLVRKSYADWIEITAGNFRRAVADGELPPVLDPDMAAEIWVSLVDGLTVRIALDEKHLPPARARQILLAHLDSLQRGDASRRQAVRGARKR